MLASLGAVTTPPAPASADPGHMIDEAAQPFSAPVASQADNRLPFYPLMQVEKAFGGGIQAVAITGTLAYIQLGMRFVVIDATDPSRPTMVGETWIGRYPLRDLRPWRNFVLGLMSEPDAVIVLDVASSESPRGWARLSPESWGEAGSEPIAITSLQVVANNLYLFESGSSGVGLRIFELARLPQVSLIGRLDWPLGTEVNVLATNGSLVLIKEAGVDSRSQVVVLDGTDPRNPRRRATLPDAHVTSAVLYEKLAFVTTNSQTDPLPGQICTGFTVYDLADPAHPREIAVIDPFFEAEVVPSYLLGARQDRLLLQRLDEVQVFDISVPAAPRLSGRYRYSVSGLGDRLALTNENGLSIVDQPFSDHPAFAGSIRLWQPGDVRPLAPQGSNLIAALLPEQGLQVIDLSQNDGAFPAVAGSSPGVTDSRIVAGDDERLLIGGGSSTVRLVNMRNPRLPRDEGYVNRSLGLSEPELLGLSGTLWFIRSFNVLLNIFDYADPGRPQLLSSIPSAGRSEYKGGLAARDSRLAIPRGTRGLDIYDISQPASVRLVANFQRNSVIRALFVGHRILAFDATWRPSPHFGGVPDHLGLAVLEVASNGQIIETDYVEVLQELEWVLDLNPPLWTFGDDFLMGKIGYRIDSLGKLHRLGQVQVKDCDVQWAAPFGDKLLVSTSDCGLLVLAGPEAVWSVYLPVVSR